MPIATIASMMTTPPLPPLREVGARKPITPPKAAEGSHNLKRTGPEPKQVANPNAASIARLEAYHRDLLAEFMAERSTGSSAWGQGQGAGNSQPPPSADVQEAMNQYRQASRLKSGY